MRNYFFKEWAGRNNSIIKEKEDISVFMAKSALLGGKGSKEERFDFPAHYSFASSFKYLNKYGEEKG